MEKNANLDRCGRVRELLTHAFAPSFVEVRDDSARHRGHAGFRAGEQTHLVVHLVAPAFQGTSRIERERQVQKVLAPLFAEGLHALNLKLQSPTEEGERNKKL